MRHSAVADTLGGLVRGALGVDSTPMVTKFGGLGSEEVNSRHQLCLCMFARGMVSLYRWASFDTVVAVGGDGGGMYCCLECAPTPASPRVASDSDVLE